MQNSLGLFLTELSIDYMDEKIKDMSYDTLMQFYD